ncbi:MAG TPA: phytanoyl-CoA dioxygenase family protein [Polyangiaceae bacterium]
MRLTDAQTASFRENGYLLLERLFEEHELAPVVSFLDAEVKRRAEQLVRDGLLSQTFEEYGFERQLAKISEENGALVQALWDEGLVHATLFDLIRHPKLLALAEQLCGSEELVAANGYWVRPKAPGNGIFEFPWHQDAGYMHPECEKVMVLAAWVPLVDSTEERGCLWVRRYPPAIGKTLPHRQAWSQPTIYIPDANLADFPAVKAAVPKGGAVLFTHLTPHASFENHSDAVRWSFDVRYQPASAPTNARYRRLPEEGELEGPLRFGCLPSEPDFLVQSRLRPEEVVTDPEAFVRLRREFVPEERARRWPRDGEPAGARGRGGSNGDAG